MDADKQTETAARRQFKMQLDDEFLTELENSAKRFARRSTQAAAEEILTLYFPHWKQAAEMALTVPQHIQPEATEAAV